MQQPDESFREDVVILFACSGASKVGEIADLAARKLHRTGEVLMSCPPAVSAQITTYLEKLKKDRKVIILDGCENDCVSKTLQHAGFKDYLHIRLDELGLTKENASVDADTVEKVVEYIRKAMKKKTAWKKHSFSYDPTKDLFSRCPKGEL